jgi:GNAT superfamily N-acetyltransferase
MAAVMSCMVALAGKLVSPQVNVPVGPDSLSHPLCGRDVLCCPRPGSEEFWVVEFVATKPEFRRQGVNNLLMQAALAKGASCVVCVVCDDEAIY